MQMSLPIGQQQTVLQKDTSFHASSLNDQVNTSLHIQQLRRYCQCYQYSYRVVLRHSAQAVFSPEAQTQLLILRRSMSFAYFEDHKMLNMIKL